MNQQQVWNSIAPEWYEYKTHPSKEVENFLKNKKGKILDLGSGAGRHLIKTKGKLYLVDFSEEMIKLAKKKAKKENINAEFSVADATKLPFEDNFFDSAICTHVLYCIKSSKAREKAIKELYRIMKLNSEILISVWDKNSKRFNKNSKEIYIKWTDKGERFYYLFDEKEINDLFKKVGFKIIKKIDSKVNITFIAKK